MRLTIRVRPGASRTKVSGTHQDDLVVTVTAPAVDGRATEAALVALAKALRVPRRDVILVTGATSRRKIVQISTSGPDELAILQRIDVLRAEART